MERNEKSRSDTGTKQMLIKRLAGSVIVLLAAVLIGMVIREFRFRSSGQEQPEQAPQASHKADIPETAQTPETQNPPPAQEVPVDSEAFDSEPVSTPELPPDANEQSNSEAQAETAAAPPEQDPRLDDPVYKEKLGREALGLIGRDPKADEVWIQIINDPSLPANARKNLIEDLNEDGLEDRRNPTTNDQPVIMYRIQLIEQLAPNAMDKTNADAFQEAYKDLVNLAGRFTRQ